MFRSRRPYKSQCPIATFGLPQSDMYALTHIGERFYITDLIDA